MLDRFLPSAAAFDPVLTALAAAVLLTLIWLIALSVRFRALGRRYRTLLDAAGGGELEGLLRDYLETAREAQQHSLRAIDRAEILNAAQRGCFQRSGVVRFDAFGDIGGNLSFSLALTDAPGNGFILTSVYGRDGCRVYAKPLSEGRSEVTLSQEEREALKIALGAPVPAGH